MLRRGLAFCMTLAMASVVQAGATITLVPSIPGPYEAFPTNPTTGDPAPIFVRVEIMLANDSSADPGRALRFTQLDLSQSDAGLFDCGNAAAGGCIIPLFTHLTSCPNGIPGAGNIAIWDFSDTPLCAGDPASCGCGHFFEQVLNGPRPNVVSSTYYFADPTNLSENTDAQRVLPTGGAALKIGELTVRLPAAPGVYKLDVVNATETNPDLGGADVRWGFGTNVNGEPLTTWRANLTSPNKLTGGTLDFVVGGPTEVAFLSSVPPHTGVGVQSAPTGGTLWRDAKNIMRLTFDGALPSTPTPGGGEVEIVELLPSGGFSTTDLSTGFAFLDEGAGVLKIQELGQSLTDKKWYAVRSTTAWTGVTPFEIHFLHLAGDATGDGKVLTDDVLTVNTQTICFIGCGDDRRADVNGDEKILTDDVLLTNTLTIVFVTPGKPSGH